MKPKTVAEFIEQGRAAGHDALGIANDPEAIAVIERMRYNRSDVYQLEDCAVFFKTKDENGELSNMCGGLPIKVQTFDTMFGYCTHEVRTTEALYQACRFPDHQDIQKEILGNKSPMGAKFVARREDAKTRKDWFLIRVDVMRWCLNLKWIHSAKFKGVLESTRGKQIVEISRKDPFWGAVPDVIGRVGRAEGQNVLGKLLMQLRDNAADMPETVTNQPPSINNMKLLGADLI